MATLQPGEPLPTLRDLIDSGQTLLVFAERGDPGGPPWYHNMYDWFQETTFSFNSKKQFDCAPNRGNPDAPLFLINHWVTSSPPNPATGSDANSHAVLEKRVEQCLRERGLSPNIIAVDFAERGDLLTETQELNDEQLKEQRTKAQEAQIPAPPPPEAGATPDVGAVTPLPEPQLVTTLTGGDPARFCRVIPAARLSITGWAVAVIQDDPSEAGLADLAYAPALVDDLGPYLATAPQELVAKAQPIADRAKAAVDQLRALGLKNARHQAAREGRTECAARSRLPRRDRGPGQADQAAGEEGRPAAAAPGGHRFPERPGRSHTPHGPGQRAAGGRHRSRLPVRVSAGDRLTSRRRS